jgi:hypothetical protein
MIDRDWVKYTLDNLIFLLNTRDHSTHKICDICGKCLLIENNESISH